MRGRHKVRRKKSDIDAHARQSFRLELDEPDAGCQLFRGKLLCRLPIFVIIEGELGKVGICIECWERALEIASDAHVETLDIRRKYERIALRSRRKLKAS